MISGNMCRLSHVYYKHKNIYLLIKFCYNHYTDHLFYVNEEKEAFLHTLGLYTSP